MRSGDECNLSSSELPAISSATFDPGFRLHGTGQDRVVGICLILLGIHLLLHHRLHMHLLDLDERFINC